MAIKGQPFLTAALLVVAGGGLSGCVYDVGFGYASDGYYDETYRRDPQRGYDAYFDCDYGHAFSDIGFAGGWYDNYFYPGHGIFLFDTFGRRYPMREQYRRYWGERRHSWYREHRGRGLSHNRYEGRELGYEDNPTSERSPSPDRQGARIRDRDNDRRDGWRDGKRNSNGEWRGGNGRGADAVPVPNPEVVQGRGEGYGRPDRRSRRSDDNAIPRQHDGGYRQALPQSNSGQETTSVVRTAPEPREPRQNLHGSLQSKGLWSNRRKLIHACFSSHNNRDTM